MLLDSCGFMSEWLSWLQPGTHSGANGQPGKSRGPPPSIIHRVLYTWYDRWSLLSKLDLLAVLSPDLVLLTESCFLLSCWVLSAYWN